MRKAIFGLILIFGFGVSVFAQNGKSLCPTIEVVGGGVVQSGDQMIFSVNVIGEVKSPNLEYEWKVSVGKIVSGQGTNSISIDTTELRDQNIEAEVKVKGLSVNCANTASEIGSVLAKLPLELFDEYGR